MPSIDITANTREAEREFKRLGTSIEDVGETLDDVSRDGDRSLDKLDRSFKDLQRTSATTSKKVTKDQDKIGEKSQEVGQEVRQNLGEGIANAARGDFAGLADTIGDTLGGAVAGIGGIATAGVAAAGALGLGAIVGTISAISADAAALEESVSKNFQDMTANGVAAWESLQQQNQRLTEAYDQHADEIRRIADLVGLPFETVAAAWAGSEEDVQKVNRAIGEMRDELHTTMGISKEAADATTQGWDKVLSPLNNTLTAYDKAKAKAKQLEAQVGASEAKHRSEIEKTRASIESLLNTPPRTTTLAVKVKVDDSEWRNWRPQIKKGIVQSVKPNGVSWQ